MNTEKNLNDLASSINSIELDESDLLKITLDSISSFCRFYPQFEGITDSLLKDNNFVQLAIHLSRDSMILGIQTLILDKNIHFSAILEKCFSKDNLLQFIEHNSDNEETKLFFKNFLSYLAIEPYTATVSRNKEITQLSEMDKKFIDSRIQDFKNYVQF